VPTVAPEPGGRGGAAMMALEGAGRARYFTFTSMRLTEESLALLRDRLKARGELVYVLAHAVAAADGAISPLEQKALDAFAEALHIDGETAARLLATLERDADPGELLVVGGRQVEEDLGLIAITAACPAGLDLDQAKLVGVRIGALGPCDGEGGEVFRRALEGVARERQVDDERAVGQSLAGAAGGAGVGAEIDVEAVVVDAGPGPGGGGAGSRA
jgi:hypothetical protein